MQYLAMTRSGNCSLTVLDFKVTLLTSKLVSGLVKFGPHRHQVLNSSMQLVVEFADVRILAFGTLNKPRSPFLVNPNAHNFLIPPGMDIDAASPFGFNAHSQLASASHPNVGFRKGTNVSGVYWILQSKLDNH
jgi:hypothetical protein